MLACAWSEFLDKFHLKHMSMLATTLDTETWARVALPLSRMAWHSIAWRGTARHGTALHGMLMHCVACMARHAESAPFRLQCAVAKLALWKY